MHIKTECFRKDHLAVLMSKRRTSNVLTILSAIVVYICLVIGLHFGECQQKGVCGFMFKIMCLIEEDWFFKS